MVVSSLDYAGFWLDVCTLFYCMRHESIKYFIMQSST